MIFLWYFYFFKHCCFILTICFSLWNFIWYTDEKNIYIYILSDSFYSDSFFSYRHWMHVEKQNNMFKQCYINYKSSYNLLYWTILINTILAKSGWIKTKTFPSQIFFTMFIEEVWVHVLVCVEGTAAIITMAEWQEIILYATMKMKN